MRAAIYSRVSTSNHDQKPEAQQSVLQDYCFRRSWTVTADLVDHGYSGGTDKRPALKELLVMARLKRVDAIVVTKMDRLFRSLKHMVSTLDEFHELGIVFVSVNEQIDMSTASGKLMTQIIAAFSEFEMQIIRERTLAGLDFARSKGKRLGRPSVRQDELIRSLREQGRTYGEIQRTLGCSKSAIFRSLKAVSKTLSKSEFQTREKTRRG